jgi:hypothetical protein
MKTRLCLSDRVLFRTDQARLQIEHRELLGLVWRRSRVRHSHGLNGSEAPPYACVVTKFLRRSTFGELRFDVLTNVRRRIYPHSR